jgi:hypothetical protein
VHKPPPSENDNNDIAALSYTFIRVSIVCVLLSLGTAVFFEAWRERSFLSSVSAYYFSPAQSIFVGSLIALAASMIALRGTTVIEDVFLNLGGIFAVFVAVVPTSRGPDHQAAVLACQHLAGTPQVNQLMCPDVIALDSTTLANVQNNMIAVLLPGAVALAASMYFAFRNARAGGRARPSGAFFFGWTIVVFLLAAVLVLRLNDVGWAVRNLHVISGLGLLGCIVVVAFANAIRRNSEPATHPIRGLLNAHFAVDIYVILAWAMIILTVLGTVLLLTHVISLFLLEIVDGLLFLLLWIVQTFEEPPVRPIETIIVDAASEPDTASVPS